MAPITRPRGVAAGIAAAAGFASPFPVAVVLAAGAALIAPAAAGDKVFFAVKSACDAKKDCKAKYADFRQYCKDQGGELASVHSLQDQKDVCKACQKGPGGVCYVGAYQTGGEGWKGYSWTDGSPMDYYITYNDRCVTAMRCCPPREGKRPLRPHDPAAPTLEHPLLRGPRM